MIMLRLGHMILSGLGVLSVCVDSPITVLEVNI